MRLSTKRLMAALGVAAVIGSGAVMAPQANAAATSIPSCHGGTDGGRRGQILCTGGPGHVRLITHCVAAPNADSGWMWDNGGSFYYYNTCWFNASYVEALSEA